MPDEITVENSTWSVWSAGTYSLTWNSTECNQWMDNAVWFGGSEIYVDDKHWRNTASSTEVLSWPNPDAWKGGYD